MAGRSNRRKGKCKADVFLYHEYASVYQDGGLSYLETREKAPQQDDAAFIFRYAVDKFTETSFSKSQRQDFYKYVVAGNRQKSLIDNLPSPFLRIEL